MKIKLFCIGKIKENYLKDGINEYVKRLNGYCTFEIVEVNDEPIKENPSLSEIEKAKNIECARVLKYVKANDYLVTLDLNKNQLDSVEFAKFIENGFIKGRSTITFVIGGSYGLSKEVKERANDSICLSKMTFTHQMTRLILLEQIYRAFKINNNEVYHK